MPGYPVMVIIATRSLRPTFTDLAMTNKMNIEKIKLELEEKYPGKKIIITDPVGQGEIIVETEATQDHPDWSRGIAVVDYIRPHYHKKLTETYKVLKGTLAMHIGNDLVVLREGESHTVKPGTVHWSEGFETWFEVYSEPGWTQEDHVLVVGKKEISRSETD